MTASQPVEDPVREMWQGGARQVFESIEKLAKASGNVTREGRMPLTTAHLEDSLVEAVSRGHAAELSWHDAAVRVTRDGTHYLVCDIPRGDNLPYYLRSPEQLATALDAVVSSRKYS